MRAFIFGVTISLALSIASDASSITVPLPCQTRAIRVSRDASTAALLCTESTGPIISLPSGKVLRTIAMDRPAREALLAPDGAWLVLIDKDGKIAAYPTQGNGPPRIWSVGTTPTSDVYLPNGLLLIDRTLWDVPKARAVHSFETDFDVVNIATINGVRAVTANADTTIRGYDMSNWKQLFRLTRDADGAVRHHVDRG